MEALKVNINERDVYFHEERRILLQLDNDDDFLIDYIYRAAKSNKLVQYGVTAEDADSGNLTIKKYEIRDQPFLEQRTFNDGQVNFPMDETDDNIRSNEHHLEHHVAVVQHVEANPQPSPEQSDSMNCEQSISVWRTKKRPTLHDIEATRLLLQLRGNEEFKKKFQDKKHNKNQLWAQIAKALNQKGFYVGEGTQAAERCRQKFANLQKMYIAFISNANKTGAGFLEPPEFYEELHNILGQKDKVRPRYLLSSMEAFNSKQHEPNYGILETSSKQQVAETVGKSILESTELRTMHKAGPSKAPIEDSFVGEPMEVNKENEIPAANTNKYTKSVKPLSNSQKIIEIITKIEEKSEERYNAFLKKYDEQRKAMTAFFETQEDNQKQFLKLFGALVESVTKKKKRKYSSDDE